MDKPSPSGSQQVHNSESEMSEMEVSYFEASQRVSYNLDNHPAWLITDANSRDG